MMEAERAFPFLSEVGQKDLCEVCPPCTQRKGASLCLKMKDCQEDSELKGLAKFPSVYSFIL